MKKWIEVKPAKGESKTKKNDWLWRVVCSNKKNNVVYFSPGFDVKATAKRAAIIHSKNLKHPLPILDTATGKWTEVV